MKSTPILLLLATLILATAGGCAAFYQTLEYDEIMEPHVSVTANSAGPLLKIAGNCGHSAHVVETIRQIKEGRVIVVEVQTSPFNRDNHSARFETEVYLDDCDFVVFGEKRQLLWRRNPGTTPNQPSKPIFVPEEPPQK